MAKIVTYASGAIWWPTNVSGAILMPSSIQVTESISGSVVPLAMFKHVISRAKVRFDTLVVWGCGGETFLDGRSFHGHQLLLSDGCTAPGKCAPESFRRNKVSDGENSPKNR